MCIRDSSRQPTQVDSKTNCDVDMRTDTNITRCFRSGPVMAVDEAQVYDCDFPPLQRDTHTQDGANRVTQKIKSGHTMNPGKVQDSKVTTFSAPSVTRGRSARPHPTLANFLNRLPDEEVSKGLEQMGKTMPRTPPITQSASILMTAPRGINSKGRSVWWEEIELWVTRKGMEPFLLPPRKSNELSLIHI